MQQISLDLAATLSPSAYQVGERAAGGTHEVVLTKPHVVDLILDLAGYTPRKNLTTLALLEPACGRGAFLLPAVRQLLGSARQHCTPVERLRDAILAYDIDESHVESSRAALVELLQGDGLAALTARDLAERWVVHADYLLAPQSRRFDFVVGNPPYIRIEQIPEGAHNEYRSRDSSLYDRADLYVAFIVRSLGLLSDGGVLCFICADRWTLNRYGAPFGG